MTTIVILSALWESRAQFNNPNVIDEPGLVTNTLGSTTFINHGLVGVGHISASAVDSFGETFGSISGLQISNWAQGPDGNYSGTLNILPDRGYNAGDFYSDYAARINQVGFTFRPHESQANIGGSTDLEKLSAQNQITFTTPITGVKFTYDDPTTGSASLTTGLDPGPNHTQLFGSTLPYVTSFTGLQTPDADSLTTYDGINRLPLDCEALVLKPDGSGYIGDEYGANVYYFDATKKIIGVIVPPAAFQPNSPANTPNFTSRTAPVDGRRNNQGFEGVSLSPDGTHLFVLLQSALVQDSNPNANDQLAKHTRLLVYDVSYTATPSTPIGEYALTLPTYTGNGKGGPLNKTCAQSEIIALDDHRVLVLSRDGNGLGNSSNNQNVFKSILLVDTQLGGPKNFANDPVRNAQGGQITKAPGDLDPTITPLKWVEVVNMLNRNQLARFNLELDSGTAQVSKLTLGEKWEGMALVSANDPNHPNDYFLFVGNDNDFLTSAGQIRGPDGSIVTYDGFDGYPSKRIPAPLDSANNENDTRILVFRVTIQDQTDHLSGIEHFIVVYQENWSFDALYGSFPGANGRANASAVSLNQVDRVTGLPIHSLSTYDPVSGPFPTQVPPVPLNGTQDARFLADPTNPTGPLIPGLDTLLPFDLSQYISPTDKTGDIVHRYWQEMLQINGGNMDRFVTWSDNPGLVMSYFDATPLPEGQLALQYVLCDNFFHSAFGGSFLNHQFFVAAAPPVYPGAASLIPNSVATLDVGGQLSLDLTKGGKIVHDGNITPIGGAAFVDPSVTFDQNYAVNTIFSANLQSHGGNPTAPSLLPSLNDSDPNNTMRPYMPNIGDMLDAANISWKWYSGGWNEALESSPSNPITQGLPNTVDPLFQWHHQAFAYYDNYKPFDASQPDGRNPKSAAHLQDEANFFDDVTNNRLPAVVFIKPLGPDNEHPGYASLQQGQQHVADIVAAVQANPDLWSRTAIIVTYDEHGGRWDHVTPPTRDIWGPGIRVPGLIISPVSKSGYVDHSQYETLSILKTIEDRFGLPPLNARDGAAATFAPAFEPALASIPSGVQVVRGGFVYDRRTQHFVQQVHLTNTGTTPVPGPLFLALDSLSSNASLANSAGLTANLSPLGSPYVGAGATAGPVTVLMPGESVAVTMEFINPSRQGIAYGARVLAGISTP